MHNDLYAYLIAEATIAATFGTRIFHEWVPQSNQIWPALVFQLVSGTEIAPDMEAPDDAKVDEFRYQFDVYDDDSAGAISAASAFDGVFRVFRGTMGGVTIQQIIRDNVSHLGDIVGDKQMRRVSLDYSITFE